MSRQRGFTLVEAVVALAIVAMIAVVLFESLRFGQRAHEKVVERGGESWQMFASQRFIRALIESAYPREPAADESLPELGLLGDPEKISVLAAAPLAAGGAGLQRYEIVLHRDESGDTDLVVRWRSDPPADESAEEVLIEDVAGLKWRYLDGEREPPVWLDSWRGRQRLPRLVRLEVTFAAKDPRTWPALVIAPRITDDANCEFDVVAQRCRRGS